MVSSGVAVVVTLIGAHSGTGHVYGTSAELPKGSANVGGQKTVHLRIRQPVAGPGAAAAASTTAQKLVFKSTTTNPKHPTQSTATLLITR